MTTEQKAKPGSTTSRSAAALVGGISLLLMAILAPIAIFGMLQGVFASGDMATTVNAVMDSGAKLRIAIALLLVVVILDVLVAWALYVVMEPVKRSISLLTAWFRLVYAGIFAVAVSSLLPLPGYHGGSALTNGLSTGQLYLNMMASYHAFENIWNLGLVLFGVHLLLLGYLTLKSVDFPGFLGYLVILSGAGYFVDGVGKILIPDYGLGIAAYTFIGEVLLIVWLFMRAFSGFKGSIEANEVSRT